MRRFIFSPAIFMLIVFVFSFRSLNTITVKGKVTDDNGKALANVTIIEKGTSSGTSSSSYGNFGITVSNQNATLVFSLIGYESKEVKLKVQTSLNVSLKGSQAALQEVVVSTYDIKREKEQTFAKDFILQGSAPGLIANGNGGATKQVRIRGTNGGINPYNSNFNTEDYSPISENGFHKSVDDPLSTFSIDVDAASYSNMRRFLNSNQLPPSDAVRIEEMINYFHYEYPQPKNGDPFSINTEISDCPWNNKHKLVLIGLQGKNIPMENLPPSNLVFLIDVSGSMESPNKLPLVQSSLKLLVDQLREEDKISIVVYAGNAGLVLPSTSGSEKMKIKSAIDNLRAGGSTAGGAGIKLAYKVAKENFAEKGNNRIILCTDGDFNVGASSDGELERLVEKERESGVFLTVLGYGIGNYKDNKMQILADKGNGNHSYIDSENEAKKVVVNEFGGTLFTIAKDVKLQIEFNPAKVQGYRLIGYENRLLNKEDFNDDKKDAGELGSGHTVTALYELIPTGIKSEFLKDVDPLKYQKENKLTPSAGQELMTVKFRYKEPAGSKSKLIELPLLDSQIAFEKTSDNFRFAASVAEFGMLLRNSEFKKNSSFNHVFQTAKAARGKDAEGYRKEFLLLVKKASSLKNVDDMEIEDVVINN